MSRVEIRKCIDGRTGITESFGGPFTDGLAEKAVYLQADERFGKRKLILKKNRELEISCPEPDDSRLDLTWSAVGLREMRAGRRSADGPAKIGRYSVLRFDVSDINRRQSTWRERQTRVGGDVDSNRFGRWAKERLAS